MQRSLLDVPKITLKGCCLILAITTLGACVASTPSPGVTYKSGKAFAYIYKQGSTNAELANDVLNCRVEASQRVPSSMQVGQTPTWTTPQQTSCYGTNYGYGTQANCYTTGGQTYGGQTYSYDANEALRKQVADQCLARKGWRLINLPACAKGVDVSQLKDRWTSRMNPLKASSCYIGMEDDMYIGHL